MEWGNYYPITPPVAKPNREMSRKEALENFDYLMAKRAERVGVLEELLRRNGLRMTTAAEDLRSLGDFYLSNVQPSQDAPNQMRSLWYAVGADIGLFLGVSLENEESNLEWQLLTKGKKDPSYHRAVIAGFAHAPGGYFVDPVAAAIFAATRVFHGQPKNPDLFNDWMEHCRKLA